MVTLILGFGLGCAASKGGNTPEQQPTGFVDFTMGGGYPCALDASGDARCRCDYWTGQTTAFSSHKWRSIRVAGDTRACGTTDTGGVYCEPRDGDSDDYGQYPDVEGDYSAISLAYYSTCALDSSGGMDCWGVPYWPDHLAGYQPEDYWPPPDETWKVIDLGGNGWGCGVTENGRIECWGGVDDWDVMWPPNGVYTTLSVGDGACALDESGVAHCWGSDYLQPTPEVPLTAIVVGWEGACAVERETQDVVCWGNDDPYEPFGASGQRLTGPYVAVDFDESTGSPCMLTPDGGIRCNSNSYLSDETWYPDHSEPAEQ